MKIKKFPQSHLVITNSQGKTLIIDPGYLTFKSGQFKISDFQGADVYLITHSHADHLGPETIGQITQDKPVYGNFDVVSKLKQVGVNALGIKDQQQITVAGFSIKAIEIAHFQKNGVKMPPNTGFLIDGVFFHPGDGVELEGIASANAAIAVGGPPDATVNFFEAGIKLAQSLGARVVIPIHYDAYPANPGQFKKLAEPLNIEVRVLSYGQETQV